MESETGGDLDLLEMLMHFFVNETQEGFRVINSSACRLLFVLWHRRCERISGKIFTQRLGKEWR